jgi:hypothetical protein
MRFRACVCRVLVFLALATAMAGCGGGEKLVKVSGSLTRNGKPVPNLFVCFTPAAGKTCYGLTDEAGRFTLSQDRKTNEIPVGQYSVWVEWRPRSPKDEMDPEHANKPQDYSAIKEKYGTDAKSPLKMDITGSTDKLEVKID